LTSKAAEKSPPKLLGSVVKVAVKKAVDKPPVVTAKALTKPVRIAKVDPLSPLPVKHSGHSKDIAAER
jgi:hypothetical protein